MTEHDAREQQGISIHEINRTMTDLKDVFREYREDHHRQMGEINVTIGRLSTQIVQYIGPVAVLEQKAGDARRDIDTLETEMKDISRKAAQVSMLGAIGALVVGLLPMPWRK